MNNISNFCFYQSAAKVLTFFNSGQGFYGFLTGGGFFNPCFCPNRSNERLGQNAWTGARRSIRQAKRHPGNRSVRATRSERAKALIINAFALSGRTHDNTINTQGAASLALGCAARLGFQPALAGSSWNVIV